MEERELIKKIKEGDTAAFSQLYEAYFLKVYNFSQLYISSSVEVAEIVQDVFVRVWESRHLFDEDRNFEGLLFIITRNLIFNYNRKYFNELNFKMTALRGMEQSYNMEDELEAADLAQFINSLVSQMPPQRQKIFRMSRERKLSNKEIAMQCAISEKAVERQITFALKFLKENLPVFILFSIYGGTLSCVSQVKPNVLNGGVVYGIEYSLNSVIHEYPIEVYTSTLKNVHNTGRL